MSLHTIGVAAWLEASSGNECRKRWSKIESAARTLRHFRTAVRHDPKVANRWIIQPTCHSSRLCSLGSMPDQQLRDNFISVLFSVCYGIFPIVAPTPSPGSGHKRRFRDSHRDPVHQNPNCRDCPVLAQARHRVISIFHVYGDQERKTAGIWSLSTSLLGFRTSPYRRFMGGIP